MVQATDLSLGTVNSTIKDLIASELIDEDYNITDNGMAALEPYKVDNAIIMAAGLSSRFAPISYERPKGVLKVLGEVLVERQIRQLQEAGITDITVVVGYMKEEFFYLGDKFGVNIVVNPEYSTRNNNSTIKVVEERLGNTYICSSDDYFTVNPFEAYVYGSYYAATFEEGKTKEYCLGYKGKNKLITSVTIGGENAWVMMGHAYWDREYSKTFRRILDDVYDNPGTAGKLWEDIYIEHIDELPMVVRKYHHGIIWEFDSLDELSQFDPLFIQNVDSTIFDNICKVLDCQKTDIYGIEPIKQGMTNLSFSFYIGDNRYVYRHPGRGTEDIINRKSEAASQGVAAKLGIDKSFIFEDPDTGFKISHFIESTGKFDYHNRDHVQKAMKLLYTLHRSGETTDFPLDMHEDTKKQISLLRNSDRTKFNDFDELFNQADELNELIKKEGLPAVICHNDCYDDNFMVSGDDIYLIDWEYSGMSDYASDLAVFICDSDYTYEESLEVLRMYFGRELTSEELLHCVTYISVVSFHWFIWALYQDMVGSPVGEYLYKYYSYTKLFGGKARELIEAANNGDASVASTSSKGHSSRAKIGEARRPSDRRKPFGQRKSNEHEHKYDADKDNQ